MTARDQLADEIVETLQAYAVSIPGLVSGEIPLELADEMAELILDRVLPRVITEDQRAKLPAGSVVMSAAGTLAGRYDETRAVVLGDERPVPWTELQLPLIVLWRGAR